MEEFEEASVPASFDQPLTKLPADDSGVRMLLVLSQFAIKQSNPDSWRVIIPLQDMKLQLQDLVILVRP